MRTVITKIIASIVPTNSTLALITVAVTGLVSYTELVAATKSKPPVLIAGPSLQDSFSTVVSKIPLSDDWLFGTAALASNGSKAITNATDLAVDFQPLQPWTGSVTINSEMARYSKTFQSNNFVFGPDYLSLKALKLVGSLNAIVGSTKSSGTAVNVDGTANPLDQLGLTTTTGLEVGQLVVVAGRYGMSRITAIAPNVSVSLLPVLNSPATVVKTNNTWIMFIHAWWAQSTQAVVNGATTIQLNSVPASVIPGMTVMVEDSGGWNLISSDAMTVASKTANSVMLNAPGLKAKYDPPAGKGYVFIPSITSGQIWSKKGYGPHIGNHRVVAMEFDLLLPQGGSPTAADMSNIYSKSKLMSLPSTLPWGAWPAAWLYQQYNGDTSLHQDNSEIDFEAWWMNSRGPSTWTGFNHGQPYYRLHKPTALGQWDASATSTQTLTPDSGELSLKSPLNAGRIKIQLVWQRNSVYKYLNNELVAVDNYQWTSAFPATFGVNLAAGALSGYYPSNLLMPWADTHMQFMELKIYEIKVWSL